MKHDIQLFDHYFPSALRIIGALPSSAQAQPQHIVAQAGQLVMAALDLRQQLLAGGDIVFAEHVPAQSYPRASAPMGTGISVQVHGPNAGNVPAGPAAPAPAAPPHYAAPPPPYAPPGAPPNIGPPYTQAPLGGGAMPPGIGVTVTGPNGQPVG